MILKKIGLQRVIDQSLRVHLARAWINELGGHGLVNWKGKQVLYGIKFDDC